MSTAPRIRVNLRTRRPPLGGVSRPRGGTPSSARDGYYGRPRRRRIARAYGAEGVVTVTVTGTVTVVVSGNVTVAVTVRVSVTVLGGSVTVVVATDVTGCTTVSVRF